MNWPLGSRRVLGLVIGDRSIEVAELHRGGGGRGVVSAVGEFELDGPLTASSAAEIGRALGTWLRERGFKARRAVIGLSARSLVCRMVKVPGAADVASVPALVRMQTERLFTQDSRELALDCVEPVERTALGGGASERAVLVVGAMRRTVEAAEAMAVAAGLSVAGVTAAPAALAVVDQHGGDRPSGGGVTIADRRVVRLMPGRAEIADIGRDGVAAIHHLAFGHGESDGRTPADQDDHPPVDRIESGLRRLSAMGGDAGEVRLWDGIGLSEVDVIRVGAAAGAGGNVRATRLSEIVTLNGAAADTKRNGLFAAAVAVGLEGLHRGGMVVDLLHPRLERSDRRGAAGRWRIASLAGAAVLAGAAYLAFDYYAETRAVAELRTLIAEQAPDVAAAERRRQLRRTAEGWFADRPSVLTALGALTSVFPEQGTIWATNVSLAEGRTGVLTGSAVSKEQVLSLMDALRDSGPFADVKVRFIEDAGRGETVSSFGIEFRYTGGGGS